MKNQSRTLIVDALQLTEAQAEITVCGWIRTRRNAKGFCFLELNDGSCLKSIQCLVDEGTSAYVELGQAGTGAALRVSGSLVPSPGKGQQWEIKAQNITVYGLADQATFPLQKKRHSDEFLRSIAHLRARTNKYGAIFRLRSEVALAIHNFFHSRHFVLVQTPILTGSDCEGAGEMFSVASGDFFNSPCQLTVSGQLEAEALATALGRVYTFGPTFRAENSNTARHAAEFWMIEPEMAFADLTDLMDLSEDLLQAVLEHILTHCRSDLLLFDTFVGKGLLDRLEKMLQKPFVRIAYAEAVEILQASKKNFNNTVAFGTDLQTEHERFLAEEHFGCPIMVYDYPKEIKAFYMRANADGKTVAAMDLLVPRIGELIGGSQREERLDKLTERMQELGLNLENYWWYLDLRRFGSVPHAGFGLGFERLIMFLTGVANIRDVIPFPRTPGTLEF